MQGWQCTVAAWHTVKFVWTSYVFQSPTLCHHVAHCNLIYTHVWKKKHESWNFPTTISLCCMSYTMWYSLVQGSNWAASSWSSHVSWRIIGTRGPEQLPKTPGTSAMLRISHNTFSTHCMVLTPAIHRAHDLSIQHWAPKIGRFLPYVTFKQNQGLRVESWKMLRLEAVQKAFGSFLVFGHF